MGLEDVDWQSWQGIAVLASELAGLCVSVWGDPEAVHALGQTKYDLDRRFMTRWSIGGNDQAATVCGGGRGRLVQHHSTAPPYQVHLFTNLNLLEYPLLPPPVAVHPTRPAKPIRRGAER
ncbi:hypothetical protein TNIN_89071 [Trichonephila inaurata madagascariensis]|uniref:Uncharacterized protein n=1 Tax=Trichonephila inaurata madagascariensis TaxID=2747483 RepID=A0A8X6XNY2_9ARAC|nr:hypothetical protein TNIN_89071 [Trichonephila inaurata madagascariensis]